MSMKHYGVETKGLVMTRNELIDLIIKSDSEILKEHFDINDLNNIDNYDVDDFATCMEYTTIFYEISGQLYALDDWKLAEYYIDDVVIITELKKDTLYDKYNNFDEIKQELKDTYKNVGIELDDDFIKKHFGKFSGAYWG